MQKVQKTNSKAIRDNRLKFLLLNKNAKLEYKDRQVGKNNYKQRVIIIGDKKYNYNPNNITKTLDKTLDKLTKDNNRYKTTEAISNVYNKIIQGHLIQALKSYSTLHYKARISDTESVFNAYANAYTITNISLKGYNGLSYLKYQYNKLLEFLNVNPAMMIIVTVGALFIKKGSFNSFVIGGEEVEIAVKSRKYIVHNADELKDSVNNMAQDIITLIDKADLPKSGLVFERILGMTIDYNRYNPTRGGSYIALPEWISNKKACINIKNEDNKCFKYSILCAVLEIYKMVHPEKMSRYNKLKENIINWNHMKYPAGNRDIDRFEESNNGVISVNVYEVCDKLNSDSIILHRRTKTINAKYHVNLLKIYDDTGKYHYVYIKDYNKLMGSQTNKSPHKLYHCQYCQHGFKRESLLERHKEKGCLAITGQSVELPKKGDTIKFLYNSRKFKCPFVIYADFECLTTKTGAYSKPINPNMSSTTKYQQHKPSGFKINVVNSISETAETFIYRGEDCIDVFFKKIREIEAKLMTILQINEKMIITDEEQQEFNNATKCYICNGDINDLHPNCVKSRDHCHFTGKYRGCAHKSCNLSFNYYNFKIPVFFHNLKSYDAHLIISNADKIEGKGKIGVIAQNSEKFIAFGFGNLIFKDSLSFLPYSLEKLVKLSKYKNIDGQEVLRDNWQDNFKFSQQNNYIKNDDDLHLLTEKGVYPYDYMDNWERFNEVELPDKEAFYSKLSNEPISDEDYERAKTVWNHFNIKDLGEYHDLYLNTDVLLLTDIFENFRNMCLEYYELDPAHYYTLPNFAWDAMLLKTGVVLEQIHDLEMYEMIESGLRGGMVQVSKKHVKANNKYMDSYNENVVSSYINYLDANNLYGLAMAKKLPYANLEWSDDIKNTFDVLNYKDDDEGYFLEVDLTYPKELHDLHSDYPLAPVNMAVKADMISEFSKGIYHKYNGEQQKLHDEKGKKLILNFMDKTKYVVHVSNLKYYLEKGLILTKIHRCIKFKQSNWLKAWIDFNTDKRTKATNDFEKDLFKLMNNAVFGKTMENVRNHCDFELVTDGKRLEKCFNNPTFKHCHRINENLVGVEKIKNVVKLNKPIYIGMAILDLSKLHMYQFFYDVLKPKYGDKIRLVYTDTDSFVIHTETEDIFNDLKELKDYMDFSDYSKEHKNYDNSNKKKLGYFKDEVNGKIITEFIGLQPKMYAFQLDDGKEEKKAKGIPKKVVKKEINFMMYKNTLEDGDCKRNYFSYNSIRSYEHIIFSITCNKSGLSNYDNKRYYFNNNESVPYRHYLCNQ